MKCGMFGKINLIKLSKNMLIAFKACPSIQIALDHATIKAMYAWKRSFKDKSNSF